jgi:hypothetical protein
LLTLEIALEIAKAESFIRTFAHGTLKQAYIWRHWKQSPRARARCGGCASEPPPSRWQGYRLHQAHSHP